MLPAGIEAQGNCFIPGESVRRRRSFRFGNRSSLLGLLRARATPRVSAMLHSAFSSGFPLEDPRSFSSMSLAQIREEAWQRELL